MKKTLLCAASIALLMTNTAFAKSSENVMRLEQNELPCQLEAYFDYDREVYAQMEQTEERLIEIKQRKLSFQGKEMVCDTFVHGGMLYVPLRQTAEFLHKTVVFSSENQTVSIVDSSSEPEQTNMPTGEPDPVSQTKKISVSRYPVHYGDLVLEGNPNPLCITGIFSCEGKLYMPLKTFTEQEDIVRVYDGDTVLLSDDFPNGELIHTPYKTGVSDEGTSEVDDETLKKALLKVAAYCAEPAEVTEIEGEKVLYDGKPAIAVRVIVVRMYESGMVASPEIAESYLYVLEA